MHGSRWLSLAATLGALASGCGVDAPPAAVDGGADGSATTCATDLDCDDGAFCNGPERCAPGTTGATSRGCISALARPCDDAGACDEATETCGMIACTDEDGDGRRAVACGGDDCDDADPNAYPGNDEVCDASDHDEDCDARTFGVRDLDGDGDPDQLCCNDTTCGTDCDDTRPGVSSTSPEVCNSIDDDCDGAVDEGVLERFLLDEDMDGYGDDTAAMDACVPTAGYTATLGGDCEPALASVHPGATEACDGADQDCDALVDEGVRATYYADTDLDTFGDPTHTVEACAPPLGYTLDMRDCDDTRMWVRPGAPELCDGLDDDCASGGGREAREDVDGDGFASPTLTGCSTTGPGVLPMTDCLDTNARANPAATTFEPLPACPDGTAPCLATNVVIRPGGTGADVFQGWICLEAATVCPNDLSVAIYGMRTHATWDWNCNGTSERPPAFGYGALACPRATPGGPVCNAMGIQYDPGSATPACGEATTLATCSPGMFFGMCTTTTVATTMPCR